MAAELTPLAVMILGLTAERPMHPYEMVQTLIARREDRFANIRPGSLYHTVDRLLDRELLRINEIERSGNRPERTVYAITAAGSRALRTRLSAMLGSPTTEFPELYLALAESHELPRTEVIDLLDRRLAAMSDELDYYRTAHTQAADRGVSEMFLLDLGCRCATLSAQLDWLRSVRDRLVDGSLPWMDHARRGQGAPPCPLAGEDFSTIVGTPAHHASHTTHTEDVTT